MKKRFFFSALTVIIFILCSVSIVACTKTPDEHSRHSWSKFTTDGATTHTRVCTECNESETKNHSWNNGELTKAATCEETGITTYTCTDCGQTKTETIGKTSSHTYGNWTSDGATTHSHSCKCGKSETKNHSWNNGVVIKQPNCKDTGIKTYACADCGQTKTETVDKTSTHTYGNSTSDGTNMHISICSICGKSEKQNHNWNSGVVTKQATCKNTGIKTFTCTDCGQTKTETIDKTENHNWSNWVPFSEENHKRTCPTCGEAQADKHDIVDSTCSVCGYNSVPATIKSVDNATIDFATSTIEMLVDKTTNSVNLSNAVKVSLNSVWKLYTADSNLIATKYAKLKDGENTFLIVVTSSDGIYDNTYTLKIYKSFEVSVNYYDVYNSVIHTETADTGYEFTVDYTPEITGYTFNYWKLNNKKATTFTPFNAINLYADCTVNDYTLTLNADGGELDKISKKITFDSAYSLPVPTKTGYTFIGWYLGDTKITRDDGASIENSKFAKKTELIAKWQVNSYELDVVCDDYSHGSVQGWGTYDYLASVTVTASTNESYTFTGWYNGETLLSGNLSYTFPMPAENVTYTAKWCKVTTESNNTVAGTVNELKGTFVAGEEVELTATTKNGYTFIGWYNGETLLTTEFIYTIKMPSEDTVFTAKWCKVSVERTSGGEITPSSLSNTYKTDDIINVTATAPFLGYNWLGWFEGETLLSTELNYTLTVPDKDITYTAKWQVKEEMQPYIFNSDIKTCTITGVNDKGITEAIIPNYVTSIGGPTFAYCNDLKEITIPDSIIEISDYAFVGCSSLKNVYISDINAWCEISFGGYYATPFYGDSFLYLNYELVADLVLPDSVTKINDYAFYGCYSLSSITIPNSVTSIGGHAFGCCKNLIEVTIPVSITSIGEYAFEYCNQYCRIYCEAVEQLSTWSNDWNCYAQGIKINVIWDCINNKITYFPIINGMRYKLRDGFATVFKQSVALKNNIIIPETITYDNVNYSVSSIDDEAFIDCRMITSITIPNSVTSIGSLAFNGCTGLTSITIPNSVTSIGGAAFLGCSGLTSITIPNSVTSIGESAFNGCTGLTSITIPNSVTFIGRWAFDDCSSLTIYCEALSKPSGWNSDWNYSDRPVVWDYKNKG